MTLKYTNKKLLRSFLEEHFDLEGLIECGLLKESMREDYEAQANRICEYFGMKTIYEYGKDEIRCHISYPEGERPLLIDESGTLCVEPFVTVINSIYE